MVAPTSEGKRPEGRPGAECYTRRNRVENSVAARGGEIIKLRAVSARPAAPK